MSCKDKASYESSPHCTCALQLIHMCAMTDTYMCDMTRGVAYHMWDLMYVSHDVCVTWLVGTWLVGVCVCVTWLVYVWLGLYMCDMTRICVTCLACVWHDSYTCDMTRTRVTWLEYVRHDSCMCDVHICVTWLIHICVTWLIHICVTWIIHICVTWLIHICVTWPIHIWVTWLIDICVTCVHTYTSLPVTYSFTCVTWLIHTCDITLSCVYDMTHSHLCDIQLDLRYVTGRKCCNWNLLFRWLWGWH